MSGGLCADGLEETKGGRGPSLALRRRVLWLETHGCCSSAPTSTA